jgi:hypothetical protein
MEECLPGSSIHAQHTTLRASEATLNRVAPRVVAIREILAGVTARLTSADESSNFAALAPDVAAEYVLRPLLMDLMAEESRAETAAREARRAMKVEWERAEKLIAQLREQAPLATRFRISEQRDLITRLVGWPAPATVA